MTFVLGQRSLVNMALCHPDLVRVVKRAIGISSVDFGVPEKAWRTLEEQREKVAQGVSKTLHSRHLIQPDGHGHAVDLVPWIDGAFTWQHSSPFYEIARSMQAACKTEAVSLTWGGVFDRRLNTLLESIIGLQAAVTSYVARHPGHGFVDLPHYQLELPPLEAA